MNPSVTLTRRQFLGVSLIAGAASALCTLPARGFPRTATRASPSSIASRDIVSSAIDLASPIPVVSIHLDQPYLDKTGTATPYVPPAGVRSGHAVSELSDVEFLSRYGYF